MASEGLEGVIDDGGCLRFRQAFSKIKSTVVYR